MPPPSLSPEKGQSGKVLLCPQRDYPATSVANFCTAVLNFSEFFDMKYLHFNPENPFKHSDWSSRAHGATTDGPDATNVFFEGVSAPAPPKKRGRPRKGAGNTK